MKLPKIGRPIKHGTCKDIIGVLVPQVRKIFTQVRAPVTWGDAEAAGKTEQEYRTAKKQLAEWGLATFRTTNQGTIATLANSDVFDINAELPNGQSNDPNNTPATGKQRTANTPATTTNNGNKENKENNAQQAVRASLSQPNNFRSDLHPTVQRRVSA